MSLSPLSSACDVIMGQAPSGHTYNTEGIGLPLVAGASDFGKISPSPSRYTSNPTKVSEPGDIILCVRATIGDLNWSDRQYCLGRGVAGLRPRKETADSRYLWHAVEAAGDRLSSLGRGATFKQITRSDIANFEILLPKELEEQRRIAAILDKADAIRRKREQILALADDFLKSIFLEMFGDPLRNPKNWRVRPLNDYLLETRYGTSIKCRNIGGEDFVPVLRIPNIVGGMVSWNELKYACLTTKELQRVRLKLGDILFVRTNGNPEYIGRCAVFESSREAAFASYLIRARLREDAKVTPLHVRAVVSFPSYRHRIIQEAKTTAGNYNINTRGLRSLPIIEPKKELQITYGRLVSQTRQIATSGEQGLRQTEDLLASLSQRAFRGEL